MTDALTLPEKITSYIAGLTDVEQDRLLVGHFIAGKIGDGAGTGCLLGLAHATSNYGHLPAGCGLAGTAFDAICGDLRNPNERTAEVGAAIRDYICELRATRELSSVREMSVV